MVRIISKKNLLHLVEQNLKEMAMDFETPDRPDRGVQDKLAAGDTTFKKVPLPKTGEEPNKNFQEVLASERYKKAVQTLRRYLGANLPTLSGQQSALQLVPTMFAAHRYVLEKERNHREELERLAIELVQNEMGIMEGDYVFDAKIVDMDQINSDDFDFSEPDTNQRNQNFDIDLDNDIDVDTNFSLDPESNGDLEDDMEDEMDLLNKVEALNLEKAKRRFINAIIQGGAKTGHYMFHYVEDRLTEIMGDPNIIEKYGVLMSINDINYWQFSDAMINTQLQSIAGKSKLNPSGSQRPEPDNKQGKKQVIYARAINFPVLVHELKKAVLEVFAKWGKSKMNDEVIETEDILKKEVWDLRLGPAIWDRLTAMMPDEFFTDENQKDLQYVLLVAIFKLPAKQFLVFMNEVLKNSQNGRRFVNGLANAITRAISDEEYENAIGKMNSDIDNVAKTYDSESLNDILSGLNISTNVDYDDIDYDDDDEDDELV